MKKLPAILFLMCLAVARSARADTIISGSVSTLDGTGSTCNATGVSASSLSLSCSDPSVPYIFSTLAASVGDLGGSVRVLVDSDPFFPPFSFSRASFDLSVTGTYMLTGGTGYGDVEMVFGPEVPFLLYLGNSAYCTVTLGTQAQSCGYAGPEDFYVPYNTPLNLDMEIDYFGASFEGQEAGGELTYELGPLTPTPEPASLLLLGTALLPLIKRFRLA